MKWLKLDHKYTITDAETKKLAIDNLKALVDRWEDDDEMYTTTMEIEIDQDFINTIKLAIEALERENCNYRRK